MRYFGCIPLVVLLISSFSAAQAADQNGYTAQYECRAGNPNCDVNVAALGQRTCDQIVTASTPWSSINWSNNTICIEPGDHSSKGTLSIPSSANGSASNYKVLRYYRSADTDDEPWNQSDGNRVKLRRLDVNGDYWLVHRITFPGISGTGPGVRIVTGENTGNVHNVIFNRLLVEGAGGGSNYYGFSQDCRHSGYDSLTVQNSVFRNLGPYAPKWEAIAVDLQCGNNLRAVNNEIYDWVSHPIQVGSDGIPQRTGIVVENNDLYVSPALYTNGGTKAKSESVLSMKAKATAANPIRIMHNRMWGARFTDLSYCCNGTTQIAGNYDSNDYVLWLNNIIFDGQTGINNVADHNSFLGNIFYKIKRYHNSWQSEAIASWYSHDGARAYEMYLNTIIGAEQYSFPKLDHDDVDVRCNVVIASGPKNPSQPPASSKANYNAFYGAAPFTFNDDSDSNIVKPLSIRAGSHTYRAGDVVQWSDMSQCTSEADAACFLYMAKEPGTTHSSSVTPCAKLGCTFQDGSVNWQAIRGPYSFFRKLKTRPERVVIPYARPHSSAPESAYSDTPGATACPANYAGRRGVGISDSD